ncbi:MAG: ABC transporter ATP-binding protein [Desulfobacteraceae bacterium]|nr:ABC transporter ATP-binding protein [Desulfobacteraceae bacterium]
MLLNIEGITRSFGGVSALAGVSFSVAAGSVHGLIGPNGAGKTTLINVLSGVTQPEAGRVTFLGKPVQGLPAHRIAALGVARTFQYNRLFPAMTCLENVIAGQHLTASRPLLPRLLCLPSARRAEREHTERAMACLERVGIAHRADIPAQSLSYGERRRLEIARALASNPRLLLLDEPVAGMHHQGLEEVGALIGSLADEGMTVLLIEHNMSFVMGLCASITVLSFGRTIATGAPQEIVNDPRVIEAYLGAGSKYD